MKFTAILFSALSLAIVSCERHEIKDTKHLYEEHTTHGDGSHGAGHGDDHKDKSSDHGKATH
jgi:hypothetical protein